ncbi:oxidoreductase [Nocardioides sp. GCM10027113]|uniref:oxidoreductase n=1 Tax=unclassified Nocardioides TaxID=2615069 RepID=UPI003612CC2E
MSWSLQDIPDLTDRVAVVTGANGGLGLASAMALAGRGAHVVMAARNQEKAAAARDEILAAHPDAALEVVELDLGSLASVRKAADKILAGHDRLDILMLNAGLMAMPEGTTEDGFERQLGVNVLGHWALLSLLLPRVVSTPGARVVTLSSVAQHTGRALDVDDPHQRTGYDAWRQYGNTKLAMRHLAQGLQRQFERAGVDAAALVAHPGLTNSDLQTTTQQHGGGGLIGTSSVFLARTTGMTTERGALSQLRAATDPSASGGEMYGPLLGSTGRPVRKPLVRRGADEAIARLWEVCERETGLTLDVTEPVRD